MARTVVEIPEIDGPLHGVRGEWSARWSRSALSCGADLRGNVATWSGSYAEVEGGGLFEDDPRTWGARGWAALESASGRLAAAGVRLCIRPHAKHVVSDVMGCRRLLEEEWGRSLVLLFDPGSMLSESMRGGRIGEDHLRRMYEAIEGFPVERLCAVIRPSIEGISADFLQQLEESCMPPGLPVMAFSRQAK